MRVVHYHWEAARGKDGVSFATRGWAKAMATSGLDVRVVCEDADGSTPIDGVSWVTARHVGRGLYKAPKDLTHSLAGADVLVIHSAWLLANHRAALFAKRLGVPYILMPHGGYDPHIVERRRILRKATWVGFESRTATYATAAHVFFDSERQHLHDVGYRGAVLVAPNGVTIPEEWRWDGGSGGYLLWLGRLDIEHKGLDLLVEAIAELPATARPQLRIHGTGWKEGRDRLEKDIRSRGVQDWVRLLPPVYGNDKWHTLAQATAFVYPSRWEACSISILEAAAIGLPIIATPYPLSRFLSDRGAALVVERSPAGIKEGITRIEESAADLGRNARRVAETELSWRAVTQSWIDQVEAILEHRPV